MANADIETPAEFIAAHGIFPNLLSNKVIANRFAEQETRANHAKRIYTFLGQYGLLAAFVTLSAVIYIVTIEHWLWNGHKLHAPSENTCFKLAFLFFGVTGVAAQVFLLGGPLKRRWLDARFHAERLRSLKFQAFAQAARGGDEFVTAFTERALGDLSVELSDRTAARHNFKTAAAMAPLTGEPSASGESLTQLISAYRILRVDRQTAFAIGEIKRVGEERKLPTSSSEVAFWVAAAFAYLDAGLAFGPIEWEPARAILHCITLELFVISALLFVLELGRAYGSALERYEDYREHMLAISAQLDHAKTAAEFGDCVASAENQALRELKAFCREAERSTYLI